MIRYMALLALVVSACTPAPEPDGVWAITAVCPASSRLGAVTINATAAVAEVSPGTYVGDLANDRGQNAILTATLNGDTVKSIINWRGGFFSEAELTRVGTSDTFAGTDSYDCAVTATQQT